MIKSLQQFIFTVLILFGFMFLFACQTSGIHAPSSPRNPSDTGENAKGSKSSTSLGTDSWSCTDPNFSFSGDELVYLCEPPSWQHQSQVFIKDLTTQESRQLTYLNGRISSPQKVKSDFIVFASDTDRKKEILTFEKTDLENENLFELYSYDLNDNEMERLTDNEVYEGFVFPYRHIDPKIVFLRKKKKTFQVVVMDLRHDREKVLFSTENPISEMSVDEGNQILVVEEFPDKKWVRWIKSEKEQFLWPEFDKKKFNFILHTESNQLLYLETKEASTSLRSYIASQQCESEVFSFPSAQIQSLKKSPVSAQTYVWVDGPNGNKRVQMGTLNFNLASACKKTAKLGK